MRRRVAALLIALVFTGQSLAAAEYKNRTTEELEAILGPIALYPDVLVSQILPASTYPDQVVAANAWIKEQKGDIGKVDEQTWDPSVRALARYSTILEDMSNNLDWTNEMGDVFMHQSKDVMAAIQTLRGKAQATGVLKDTPEQKVVMDQEGDQTYINIEPAQENVVYVPQYDPQVVYVDDDDDDDLDAVGAGLLGFGVGMVAGAWLNGGCNWHGGYVGYGGGSWAHVGHYNGGNYNSNYRSGNTVNINSKRTGAAAGAGRPGGVGGVGGAGGVGGVGGVGGAGKPGGVGGVGGAGKPGGVGGAGGAGKPGGVGGVGGAGSVGGPGGAGKPGGPGGRGDGKPGAGAAKGGTGGGRSAVGAGNAARSTGSTSRTQGGGSMGNYQGRGTAQQSSQRGSQSRSSSSSSRPSSSSSSSSRPSSSSRSSSSSRGSSGSYGNSSGSRSSAQASSSRGSSSRSGGGGGGRSGGGGGGGGGGRGGGGRR